MRKKNYQKLFIVLRYKIDNDKFKKMGMVFYSLYFIGFIGGFWSKFI